MGSYMTGAMKIYGSGSTAYVRFLKYILKTYQETCVSVSGTNCYYQALCRAVTGISTGNSMASQWLSYQQVISGLKLPKFCEYFFKTF